MEHERGYVQAGERGEQVERLGEERLFEPLGDDPAALDVLARDAEVEPGDVHRAHDADAEHASQQVDLEVGVAIGVRRGRQEPA